MATSTDIGSRGLGRMNPTSLHDDDGDDYVRVATCGTPTEAHLLQGMLQSHGIAAIVPDANFIQADTWMTQAVGGVRVLVRRGGMEAARTVIADFDAGAFELDGDGPPPVSVAPLTAPVFSPDRIALLSLVLTPAFGAMLQWANSMSSGSPGDRRRDAAWLVFLGVLTALAVWGAHRIQPGPWVVIRASWAMSFVTVVWYFVVLQPLSKALLTSHGRHYPKRPVRVPALVTLVIAWGLGWAISG
ncbi:hypothetical protein AACH06_11530 [Ideonella sp. DXS29W]|uniref:DUF2007 domain-containing protein n=1 Tax=Ideonella lacteola TaxID=2984193 RepID=A0ABU9BNB3_9BURK